MLIFQTETPEEDDAVREQGAFSPYTVALIVSKRKFLAGICLKIISPPCKNILQAAIWLFIEKLAFFNSFLGENAKRRIKVIFYLDICPKKLRLL